MNEPNEDLWDMSTWRKDIPQKVSYLERQFKALECPENSRRVLLLLERYFQSHLPGTPPKPGLFEAAFISNMVERYLLHCAAPGEAELSAVQELALLEVLCMCLQDQDSSIMRCAMFDLIFGFTSPEDKDSKLDRRVDILSKLVSMAVALQCKNVLDSAAVWMQRHSHAPEVVLQVASHLVEDYINLVPASIPYLESAASQSPLLACQLMIAFNSLFCIKKSDSRGFMLPHSSEVEPSMEVLKVVVSWIGDTNTDVCMATPPASLVALPSLLRTMPEPSPSHLPTHPVLGLIRWACLLPLLKSVTVLPHDQAERAKHLHSQLQLGILQTLLAAGGDLEKNQDDELEPGEVEDEVDTEHLIVLEDLKELATDMLNLVEILKGDPAVDQDVTEHQTQLAVDRFAQVNQVALTTGCLPCRREQLLTIHRSLPKNRLLAAVMDTLNTS